MLIILASKNYITSKRNSSLRLRKRNIGGRYMPLALFSFARLKILRRSGGRIRKLLLIALL